MSWFVAYCVCAVVFLVVASGAAIVMSAPSKRTAELDTADEL